MTTAAPARRCRGQPRCDVARKPRDASPAVPCRRPRKPAASCLRVRPFVSVARRRDRSRRRRPGVGRRPSRFPLRAHLRARAGAEPPSLPGEPARARAPQGSSDREPGAGARGGRRPSPHPAALGSRALHRDRGRVRRSPSHRTARQFRVVHPLAPRRNPASDTESHDDPDPPRPFPQPRHEVRARERASAASSADALRGPRREFLSAPG